MTVDYEQRLQEPSVFYDQIEPNDIRQGALGDCWFMCALACLAERPALVERLFVTKQVNDKGIYRVKLCKNGEWVTVTVDDFFPCYPKGGPVFSRAHGNELWVLLLEKAYAKLHGSYFQLRGGFANEGMIDLTGCPSAYYDFKEDFIKLLIENGEMWKLIVSFDQEGYLISASTPGEDKFTEVGGPDQDGGLIPGHAYSIIQAKEALGHRLLNIRNPWGNFEWDGDWSDQSPKWTKEMREIFNPSLDETDGTFWMSFDDFTVHFRALNVCRVKNWEEIRIKGKFIRVQDIDDPDIEVILSKWYYSLDVSEPTRIFIGVHQEDERIHGVLNRRPYLDVGISILKRTSDGVTLVDLKDLVLERQNELDVVLDPGSYIILPRTTGCTLRRPIDAVDEHVELMDKHGAFHELFEITLSDIFRKFDMLLNRELSYSEFRGFFECIGRNLSQDEF